MSPSVSHIFLCHLPMVGNVVLSELLAPTLLPHALLGCCAVVGLHLSWGMER